MADDNEFGPIIIVNVASTMFPENAKYVIGKEFNSVRSSKDINDIMSTPDEELTIEEFSKKLDYLSRFEND